MDKPADIDQYLATVPAEARVMLEELRRTIRAVAPEAAESISYGVATFKHQGRPLAYIGAAKKHCALYGLHIGAHQDELAAYDTSKGTIRFSLGSKLPLALVKTLVSERKAEIEAAAVAKPKKASARAGSGAAE